MAGHETLCNSPFISLGTCTRVLQLHPKEPVSVSLRRAVRLVWAVVTGLVTARGLRCLWGHTGRGLAPGLGGCDLRPGGLGLVTTVSCATVRVSGGGAELK